MLIRNSTQTAVTNMTIKRILENKLFNFKLTFRKFQHTSSEVTVRCMTGTSDPFKIFSFPVM